MTAEIASVEVQRDVGGLTDYLRAYDVVIDGEVVDRLRPGDSRRFEVAPGTHEIFLKIDWCRSEKVDVHLTAGETARFRCAPHANLFTDLYWSTLGRHRYISLTQVTG